MQDATDVDAAKRALRAQLRRVRAGIAADPVDRLARSTRIWVRIVAIVDLGAHRLESETLHTQMPRVMLFRSLPTEPDTAAWLDWCRDRGIAVHLPEVDGAQLRVEPGDLDPMELDVVVVPGLGFTPDGRRLGQGGGHYDRFLPRLRPDCTTIGACFAEQILGDLPTTDLDRPVDHVATDG